MNVTQGFRGCQIHQVRTVRAMKWVMAALRRWEW
jgi:hypothetical protein